MTATLTFNVTQFRLEFPEFASATTYPTPTLQQYWNTAILYISNQNAGVMQGDSRQYALDLMTAHLTKLSGLILAGQTPQIINSSTVGSVSVSLTPPPFKTSWTWWLSTTPYGLQLIALLEVNSVGGGYYGGLPEGSAFRRVGGVIR